MGSGSPDDLTPAATPSLMNPSRTADKATALSPIAATRVEPKGRTDGHKEDHQYRRRATADGGPQRVALRDRQVLDHHARGESGQQRLELLRRAHLTQHGAHRQQHQGDFPADVAQVQGEQDADRAHQRRPPHRFPTRVGARISRPRLLRCSNTTRASSIDTENSTRIARSAITTTASTVSLSRPRAPESATTAAVIVGENETTITTSNASMTSRSQSAGRRAQWAATARRPCHGEDADDGDREGRRGHARDGGESARGVPRSRSGRRSGDQRRRDPVTT